MGKIRELLIGKATSQFLEHRKEPGYPGALIGAAAAMELLLPAASEYYIHSVEQERRIGYRKLTKAENRKEIALSLGASATEVLTGYSELMIAAHVGGIVTAATSPLGPAAPVLGFGAGALT